VTRGPVTSEYGTTVPEKLGASAGAWAALWILVQYVILRSASADPLMPDYDYVRALVSERMTWEWATAIRVMGGLMIIWFMGSLSGRLRLVEGEPGRLASIASAVGIVWGAVWLLSAMFNSAAILLATQYNNPTGARLLGMLARESVLILTPSIVFALSLAVAFVTLRFGGFPKAYTYATTAFTVLILVLAIVDWYGPGNVAPTIMTLGLAWLAITSALTVPTYRPADLVRGAR
jgi:hypothetical protein